MRETRSLCSSIISLHITIQELNKKVRLVLMNNKFDCLTIIHQPNCKGKNEVRCKQEFTSLRDFDVIILQLPHWPEVPNPQLSPLSVSDVSCSWLSLPSSAASSHLHQPRCSPMVCGKRQPRPYTGDCHYR